MLETTTPSHCFNYHNYLQRTHRCRIDWPSRCQHSRRTPHSFFAPVCRSRLGKIETNLNGRRLHVQFYLYLCSFANDNHSANGRQCVANEISSICFTIWMKVVGSRAALTRNCTRVHLSVRLRRSLTLSFATAKCDGTENAKSIRRARNYFYLAFHFLS